MRGVEALVRWNHPQRGVVQPDEFIPAAEDTGLIVPIGSHVLLHACRDAARWQAMAHAPTLTLSVNLSPRQLQHPGLVADVEAAMSRAGLAPDSLILELTEGALLHRGPETIELLQSLKALGVRLAIDDFGTG